MDLEFWLSHESDSSAFASAKLWHQGDGKMFRRWREFCEALEAQGEDWDVWTNWFQDRIAGRPGIEALEVERALIPDAEWKKGPKHVNALIKAMIRDHKVPVARELGISAKGEVARAPLKRAQAIPDEVTLQDIVAGVRDRLIEMIDWHREPERWQEYNSLDRPFSAITGALLANDLNPERLHGACTAAMGAIARRVDQNHLRPTVELDDLVADLDQTARQIRAVYPAIAAVHEAANALRPAPTGPADAETLNEAAEALAGIVETEFADDLKGDVAALEVDAPDDPALAEVNKPVLQRILGYFIAVRRLLKTPAEQLLARVDKSVDVAKKIADFQKVSAQLEALWDRIKVLIDAMIG